MSFLERATVFVLMMMMVVVVMMTRRVGAVSVAPVIMFTEVYIAGRTIYLRT